MAFQPSFVLSFVVGLALLVTHTPVATATRLRAGKDTDDDDDGRSSSTSGTSDIAMVASAPAATDASPVQLVENSDDASDDEDDDDTGVADKNDQAESSKVDVAVQQLTSQEEAERAALDRVSDHLDFVTLQQTQTKTKLADITDPAAQAAADQEVSLAVKGIQNETDSKALGSTLGKMWSEMRMFAGPFYEEHLENSLADLHKSETALRAQQKQLHAKLAKTRSELKLARGGEHVEVTSGAKSGAGTTEGSDATPAQVDPTQNQIVAQEKLGKSQNKEKYFRIGDHLDEDTENTMKETLPDKLNEGDTPSEKARNSLFFLTVVWCGFLLVALFLAGFTKLVASRTPTDDVHNFYDRIVLKHVHGSFASNFELAARGALVCVLIGLPFFVPKGYVPTVDWIVEEGLYTPLAVIYFVYTLYKTVGDTVYFARCGFLGTLLAVMDCWLLYGLKPEGVVDEHYARHWINHTARFWIWGVLHSFIITFLVFWFNVDGLTRVFFLTTAVWFWMDFLNPNGVDNYSKNFVINPTGSATRMLLDCGIGCVFAIVAVSFPFPFWAITKARENVAESVAMMEHAWGEMQQAVCVEQLTPVVQESVIFRLRQVQQLMADASDALDTAYYECFRMGTREQSRKMLRAVIKACQESDAQIQSTLCCLGTTDKSEKMAAMSQRIDVVVKTANKMFTVCSDAACAGGLTQDDKRKLQNDMPAVRAGIGAIAAESVKHSLAVSQEAMDDHTFTASVCAYGNIACHLGEQLIKDFDGSTKLQSKVTRSTLQTTFDPAVLSDTGHMLTCAKDTFKIMLGFWIGYFGYMEVIPPYTAGVASTMALLLGSFVGSALVKNMGRLQGVVFGMVVGQIFYAAFGWCTWWGYLGVMTSLFGLVGLGLFLYYHSVEHGTLGCLLAAFGAQCLLMGCKESGNHIDRSAYYSNILVTVVAVLLVCAIDTISAGTRASKQAHEKLVYAWRALDTSLNSLLDPSRKVEKRKSGALRANIAAAANMSVEAGKEPRFWRTPFRAQLFAQTIETSYKVRFSLSLAEHVATSPADSSGGASPPTPRNNATFKKLAGLPQFVKVRDIVMAKMRQLEVHFELFLHETDHEMRLTPKMDHMKDFNDALAVLFEVLAKDTDVTKSKAAKTVEDLPACQVCVVLNAAESIMKELCCLDKALYGAARSAY